MRTTTALFCAGLIITSTFACTGLEYQPLPEALVQIVTPDDGIIVTNPVELAADARDEVGGDIGFLVVWSSDVDGVIGEGAAIRVELSAGAHSITASVDDSRGRKNSTVIELEVE